MGLCTSGRVDEGTISMQRKKTSVRKDNRDIRGRQASLRETMGQMLACGGIADGRR